jgi:hypothetical protein
MNVLRCCIVREEVSSAIGTSTNKSHFSYPYSGESSLRFWQFGNCQQLNEMAGEFL